MTVARQRAGWGLWLSWVLSNFLGWILGMAAAGAGDWAVYPTDAVWVVLALLEMGALLGATQWLVLRRRLRGSGLWIVATTVGVSMGLICASGVELVLASAAGVGEGRIYATLVGGTTVLGLSTGITQWLVLRQEVRAAGWWIVVSALGWALAGTLIAALAYAWVPASASGLVEYLGWGLLIGVSVLVLGSLVPAAVTGLALVWLLRQPASEA